MPNESAAAASRAGQSRPAPAIRPMDAARPPHTIGIGSRRSVTPAGREVRAAIGPCYPRPRKRTSAPSSEGRRRGLLPRPADHRPRDRPARLRCEAPAGARPEPRCRCAGVQGRHHRSPTTTPTARPSAARPSGRMRRSADPARERVWRSAWVLTLDGAPLRDGAVAVRDGRIAQVGPGRAGDRRQPGLPVEDLAEGILTPGVRRCPLPPGVEPPRRPPAVRRLRARGSAACCRCGCGCCPATRHRGPPRSAAGARGGHDDARRLRPHRSGRGGRRQAGQRGRRASRGLRPGGWPAAAHEAAARFAARWRSSTRPPDRAGAVGRVAARPLHRRPRALGRAARAARPRGAALGDPSGRVARTRNRSSPPGTGRSASCSPRPASRRGGGRVRRARARSRAWPPPACGARGWWRRTACGSARETRRSSRDAGVGVAHCPRSNSHLRCGRAPLESLRLAGVAVGLGTDSPASGGDYDLRAEARACRAAHDGRLAIGRGRAAPDHRRGGAGARPRGRARQPGRGSARRPGRTCAPRGRCDDPWEAALAPGTAVAHRRRGRGGAAARRGPDPARRRGDPHPCRRGARTPLLASRGRAPRPEAHPPDGADRRDTHLGRVRRRDLRRPRD